MKTVSKHKHLNKGIFFTSIVFGISSWVVFSGIYVETPLLLQKLPEGWKIPSLLMGVSQFAQIGPILLFLCKCKCIACLSGPTIDRIKKKQLPDRAFIYILFFLGISAGICMALFWDKTFFVFGQERSVAFLTSVFFLAILDCTCTIVFLTYIGSFRGNYTTALYIGEGVSSLLPSFFALLQGTGDEEDPDCGFNNSTLTNTTLPSVVKRQPRFSISAYFWLLLSTLVVSFIGFLMLEFWPSFQKEKTHTHGPGRERIRSREEEEATTHSLLNHAINLEKKRKKRLDKVLLLIGITVVAFVLYGFIPGLASYSALPYGHNIMHLCVTLGLITQPISSLIATFIQIRSTLNIWILEIISLAISGYIFIFSLLSPCPPFKETSWGGPVMVLCWVIVFGLFMFLRCCITSALKRNHGKSSLFWCGVLTQVGQFIGSITTYVLVDVFSVFKEANACEKLVC